MKFLNRCGLLLLLAGALAGCNGCNKPATTTPPPTPGTVAPRTIEDILPRHAQPRLPTIKVWLGPEELITEMALTPEQQMAGMMFRTNSPENQAMIFVHDYPRQASYWMKNCPEPLSIAFIDDGGIILEIHEMKANDTNSVVSAANNVRFALETRLGWFDRHNIRTGMVVRTERGPLMETFFRRQ